MLNITLKQREKREIYINLRQELHIKENGLVDSEMAMELKYGLMGLDMRGNGRTIELMDMENLFILMEMFMKEIG
jgi:hypothetical protein